VRGDVRLPHDDRVLRADAGNRHLVRIDILREDVEDEIAISHHPDEVLPVHHGQ
jgi:hypothetical protein